VNPNDPETPPQIQLTPVAFSPSQPEDSIGPIGPPPAPPPLQFSAFWPLLILLLTLIFGTARDVIALNKRMVNINVENAPALALLKNSNKQTAFIESLRVDLQKLSPTDPVAAQISAEYFPPPPAPAPVLKTPGQDGAPKAPAK